MKRRDIKNILNTQMEKKTPKLSAKVTKTPLDISRQDTVEGGIKAKKSFALPKWAYAVACIAVVVVLATSFGLYYGLSPSGVEKPQTVCYVVDINPSIAITVDKEGKVTHLSSQNSDGDIVLASSVFDSYKNMKVEECVNAIIKESAKLGYIDCNGKDNKVTLTLVGDDKQNKTSIDKIADSAQKHLRDLNIYGYIDTAVKDVKTFVESKGWKYSSASLDGYIDKIKLQSKYVCGAQYGGDFESEAEEYIDGYYEGIVYKKNLLDALGIKLEEVENSDDISTNYWIYKSIEGTFLAPPLSAETKQLVNECDSLVQQLNKLGISVGGTADYAFYSAKYSVAEELAKFFENLKVNIYDSDFFNLFLKLVDDEDIKKFEWLQDQINSYYNDVVSKLSKEFDSRISQFLSIFDNRAEISDKEYDDYLQKVSAMK